MQLVLVQHERLARRQPVLAEPEGGTLVEPDHLLDVVQQILQPVRSGIGADPRTTIDGKQGRFRRF